MKLIHLSDLHLGKRVGEVSMLEDQAYILDRVLDIVDGAGPDALLIAGDVYDKSVPSAEAVTLFDGFLCRLAPAEAARAGHQRQPRLPGAAGLRRPADGGGGGASVPRVRREYHARHPDG